jgi:hypothetical protein
MLRFIAGSFALALTLAGLAIASVLGARPEDSPPYLEPLAWIFFIGALVFLAIAFLVALAWLALLIRHYFHAVDAPFGQWYCRYWPAQRIAHVSGVKVRTHQAEGRVRVHCEVRFVEDAFAQFSTALRGDGTHIIDFPQQGVDFANDPQQGDLATVTVTANPDWWRGRPSKRTRYVEVDITDHRPSVTPEQVESALKRLDGLVDEAQRILERCGRPQEQMRGADPMDFQEHCVPRIIKFQADATKTIAEVAPEYMGKFTNVGNVTHNVEVKPAMIQQVEKWLDNLGAIQDELRRRL